MTKFAKSNLLKIAVVVAMLVFATTCVVSGTLASLSAEYVWSSDTAEAGVFAYEDSSYELDLFDSAYIYPGDSGSGAVDAPDFGSNAVVWSFSETNADTMPVIFYTLDGEGNIVAAYSKYAFASSFGTDYYLRLSGKYVASTAVSTSSAALTALLADDAVICWAWPAVIYDSANAAISDAKTAAYDAYNEELCSEDYAFNSTAATFINTNKNSDATNSYCPMGVITSVGESGFNYTATAINGADADKTVTLQNGKLKLNGEYLTLHKSSGFVTPTDETEIAKDDYYAFVVLNSNLSLVSNYLTSATAAGVRAETDGVSYATDATTVTVSESGKRAIVRIYPTALSTGRATIGVTVSAIVTKA